ncbi:hypothetical protein TNCV_3440581 [Trichonephila clavipes]|uniref:Uncharacterized protein n=1 Tax=Trichonephila clavipes TaxID=2585209 RepID=A0A8X6W6N6_TRICX|nr:hypothetical protein TNCV_3440581 [Trichonephila clavipes]
MTRDDLLSYEIAYQTITSGVTDVCIYKKKCIQPQPLHTRRRWSSTSRVKRDSLLNTMRYQSDYNQDHRRRHNLRRFRQCCGVKGRSLKGRCESNLVSAKLREMGEGATGDVPSKRAFGFLEKKLEFAASNVACNTMKEAALEIRSNETDTEFLNVVCRWMAHGKRRGYSSLNGCVSVISIDSGKVLHVEFMSK